MPAELAVKCTLLISTKDPAELIYSPILPDTIVMSDDDMPDIGAMPSLPPMAIEPAVEEGDQGDDDDDELEDLLEDALEEAALEAIIEARVEKEPEPGKYAYQGQRTALMPFTVAFPSGTGSSHRRQSFYLHSRPFHACRPVSSGPTGAPAAYAR